MDRKYVFVAFIGVLLLFCIFMAEPNVAFAELTNEGIMNDVMQKYQEAAGSWAEVMQGAASRLFISLAAISLVWTIGQLPFHRSSFAEFFGELLRYIIFTGFFYWLLINAPQLSDSIIMSLRELGGQASGQGQLYPSGVVDIGFKLYDTVCVRIKNDFSLDMLGYYICAWFVSVAIMILMALVAINMLIQICAAWILAYAGIFFLGFGATKWTSDIAINYFKTVIGLGASLMTMTLLVGIGTTIIQGNIEMLSPGEQRLTELGVVLISALTLFLLVDKLPAMVAGIINGSSIGTSMSVGAFGAGAAVGAAGVAMGAVKLGGAIIGGSAVGAVATAASALTKAGDSALSAMQQGTGAFAGMEQRPGQGAGLSRSMGITTAFATEVGKSLGKQAGGAAMNSAKNAAQKIIRGK